MLIRSGLVVGEFALATASMVGVFTTIVVASMLTGWAYHLAAYDQPGSLTWFAAVGVLAALLFTLPFVHRDEYRFEAYTPLSRRLRSIFTSWNYAFLGLALLGFLTKTTGEFSRGWLLIFYTVGLVAIIAVELAILRLHRSVRTSGVLAGRRLMVVGSEPLIREFFAEAERRGGIDSLGHVAVLSTVVLPVALSGTAPERGAPTDPGLAEALECATKAARQVSADSILLLTPLDDRRLVEAAVQSFSRLPVTVHMSLGSLLAGIDGRQLSRLGDLPVLTLTERPLSPLQAVYKRLFDLVVATTALLLLAPLLAGIAALIKLDSKGPVFFRQRRSGYNLSEFRIWKFRTMSVLEDGDAFVQVRPGDARVTRVGKFLRRWNLDELPQLFNVLAGEMSIVGPRPHAVAHDREFEKRIAAYPRRLNVRPGITGWAQVNGLRGMTDTEEKMSRRVEHDLYYVDNWSLMLDVYIVLLTAASPRAFRNAC
ncbi:MAG: exopolysaccharide biosynthesis polyprenyl glycosylphosphotransferase [Pseudomonadota bacterium]